MTPRRLGLATLIALSPTVAIAAEADSPDWPCVQRKVPTLTPAAVWTGPAFEDGAVDWSADQEVADLAVRLSQRRLPEEDAEAQIEEFAAGLSPDERERRMTLLFAGLFDTMNDERSDVIEGIERYARGLKEMAAEIRRETARLPDAATAAGAASDPQRTDLDWRTRIFNERRQSLTYVCEVPRLVEQRLFALGRAITKVLD